VAGVMGRSTACATMGWLSSSKRMRCGMLSVSSMSGLSSVSLAGMRGGGWSVSGSFAIARWCSAIALGILNLYGFWGRGLGGGGVDVSWLVLKGSKCIGVVILVREKIC
jgi:hypothetical protein